MSITIKEQLVAINDNGEYVKSPAFYLGELDVAVQKWLNAHPEATTSIADGSIEERKFANSLIVKTIKDYVTPEMFDAAGDGIEDDTNSVQSAISFAAANGKKVYFPAGKTYLVGTIVIENGITEFVCDGVLKGKGGNVAVLSLGGGIYSENPAEQCYVKANIDMSNGNMYGIRGLGVNGCVIDSCRIYGLTDSQTTSRIAISLEKESCNNKICNNFIIGHTNPYHALAHVGIRITSDPDPEHEWAGFFDGGEIVDSPSPSLNNLIANNFIAYGETAIDLLGNEQTIVKGNHCYKQSTRAIYCAMAENHSVFDSNEIVGFAASAILLGYGCHNNIISNNIARQISEYNMYGGEAAINIICGCYENIISGNEVDAITNYGIYLAVNSINNVVDGNTVKNYYVAAIALESDWADDPPSPYSRPNYGAPPIGDNWASKDSTGNVIQNNLIKEGYPGRMPCSIFVAQVGTVAKIKYNTVQNNNMVHPQLGSNWPIRWDEETPEYMEKNNLINNHIRDVNVNRINFTRGKAHFTTCYGNDGIDTANVVFPNDTDTPSVGKGKYFLCQYSEDTDIHDFVGGMEGQEIIVSLNQNTRIIQYGAKIILKGNENARGNDKLSFITFKKLYGVWHEICRNF